MNNKFYKIIHTSSRCLWGNREKRILHESLWMKKNGHQVAIIAPGDSPLFKKAKQNELTVYPISFKSLAGLGEYGQLKQIFDREQPFVVNAHGKADAKITLKAAQATGVPCRIMSRHNGKRVRNTWANKKIYKSRCHHIFTNSKDSKKQLKQTFSLSDMQIFCIPDGVTIPDAAVFPNEIPQPAARQKLANILGLETDARFIGVFDKAAPQNNLQLRKTAEQLNRQFPSHHLVVAGIPENQNTIYEGTSPRLHLLPQNEEKDTFYQALDCCLYFPNLRNFYQGVPLEVIRAMSCLCPVIGPDAAGIRDILIDHKTGRIFDPNQTESLPNIIQWTLNTPQTILTLTREARAMVEQHYTMDAMGRDILRIYQLRQIKVDRKRQMPS